MIKALEPVTPQESDKPKLQLLDGVIHRAQEEQDTPKLIGPGGLVIELPESVFRALYQIVYHMLRGNAVNIIPIHKEMTTQEAADFLNVSRPFFIKLLDENKLPYSRVGAHRRVRFKDVLEYKKTQAEERKRALTELTHIAEDEGIYD